MTGPEHFQRAETLLEAAAVTVGNSSIHPIEGLARADLIARAQVHATLALAAATALAVDVEGAEPQTHAWAEAGAW